MKKIIFTLILIIFIYLLYFKFYKKEHKFWDKQPVSRNNIKNEGIIANNPKFNIILNNNMYFKNMDIDNEKDFNLIHTFINDHYTDTYIYPKNFLKDTLKYLKKNECDNIGLFNKNNETDSDFLCNIINDLNQLNLYNIHKNNIDLLLSNDTIEIKKELDKNYIIIKDKLQNTYRKIINYIFDLKID